MMKTSTHLPKAFVNHYRLLQFAKLFDLMRERESERASEGERRERERESREREARERERERVRARECGYE